MSRSFARTAVLAAVTAAALTGAVAAPAFAATDPAPAPGTAACTAAVAANDTVVSDLNTVHLLERVLVIDRNGTSTGTAATVVDGAITGTGLSTPAQLAQDQANIDAANAALRRAREAASTALCTGTAVATTPSTVTADPTSPPVVPAPRVVVPAGVPDRNCADFATQADAQAFFVANGGSALRNVDDLDANHNGVACEDHFAVPAPTTVTNSTTEVNNGTVNSGATVNPTQSDGSVATTSGSQVTDVPAGSVSTGAR